MIEYERENIKLSILGAIGVFVLNILCTLMISLPSVLILKMFGLNYEHPLFDITLSIIVWILVIRWLNERYILSVKSNLIIKKEYFRLIIPVILTILGIGIVGARILNYMIIVFPVSDFMKKVFESTGEISLQWRVIRGIIVAPITEEILSRGIILDGLLRKYSKITAVLISAFIFGAMHLNIYQFPSTFLGALFLGWVYVRTKSLFLCIIGHMVNNSSRYIPNILNIKIPGYNIDGVMPLWFLGLCIVMLITGVLFIKKICDRDFNISEGVS